jgi:hypothetical protein
MERCGGRTISRGAAMQRPWGRTSLGDGGAARRPMWLEQRERGGQREEAGRGQAQRTIRL